MFFPSECVLERRVRSDGDLDLADKKLQLFMLKCKDRKADGYAGKDLEIYNERVKKMNIGVSLAAAPPAVSYLVILGARLFAKIVAVDKTVIVIMLGFTGDGGLMSYLIYDAVALSLRMIPPATPGSNVSIARSCQGDASYALVVHTGVLAGIKGGVSLHLWQPSSSSWPWSKFKKYSLSDRIDWSLIRVDMEFSFKGHAYWVDLVRGISYCSCDVVLEDNSNLVEFGFIPLPSEARGNHRNYKRVALPVAYRAMGVTCDSIRFVSINGFQDHVEHKDRTVTVWKLLGHGKGWEKKHELSLETLWGYQGFGDVPKDLTPMYPVLSTKDVDVVYLALGEFCENLYKKKFYPRTARYLLAVDLENKIVTSVPLARWIFDSFVSFGFSRSLRKALVGPCDDDGIPRDNEANVAEAMKKPRPNGGNVVEALIPKKKPRRNGGNVAEA
uniref:Uncharacterized protein n=1 Tax=Avena sativa TaxID=4498 RepID=A0ACD5UFV8_AVESA